MPGDDTRGSGLWSTGLLGATDRVRCSGTGPGSEVFTAPAQRTSVGTRRCVRTSWSRSASRSGRGRIRCMEIRANPSQRMSTTELAQLHGVELEEYVPGSGADGTREEKFLAQLDELQPPSVIDSVRRLLSAWIELDGYLDFGKGDETSCFLMLAGSQTCPDIWPLTLYPSGRSEVVFQHLARRPPFDDPALREQLRQRLNTVEGVDLPAAKIELRPSFPLAVLNSPVNRGQLIEHLKWFRTITIA